MSEEFFSKVRIDIEEQKRALSTFATRTDVSQNDKAILLKAEYYLLRLSRVLYDEIDSALFRLRESQNAFPELHGKTKNRLIKMMKTFMKSCRSRSYPLLYSTC